MPSIHTPVELGAVIRAARERKGWTQSDLALRARVTRQWLARMEKGRHDKAEVGLVLTVLKVLGMRLYVGEQAEPVDRHGGAHQVGPVDLDALIKDTLSNDTLSNDRLSNDRLSNDRLSNKAMGR